MKTKRYLICAAALLTVLPAGCATMQEVLSLNKPTAKLTGLEFADVRLDSATLLFDVEVDNPYAVALPLLNMDYGLSSSGNQFLSGSAELQTTVPAKSTKTVSLPAKINYMDMLQALKGIRLGSKIPYKADLGLSVKTPVSGSIRLPLKRQGELALPAIF